MIFHGLDTLHLTQPKGKKLSVLLRVSKKILRVYGFSIYPAKGFLGTQCIHPHMHVESDKNGQRSLMQGDFSPNHTGQMAHRYYTVYVLDIELCTQGCSFILNEGWNPAFSLAISSN